MPAAGLRAGDGVFETVRTYEGQPFLLDRHLHRLSEGARAMGLSLPVSGDRLEQLCRAALAQSRAAGPGGERVLRPMVYADGVESRFVISVEPLKSSRQPLHRTGIVAGASSYPHPGKYLVPPGASAPVKWLARGPLSHAFRDARKRGWEEAILRGSKGEWIEGTRSNLLAVVKGRLVAPGPESHALPGITRDVVLEEARRLGIPFEGRAVEAREIRSATEILLVSTLLGVAEVSRVAGGWSKPRRASGPMGGVLQRAFDARVREEARTFPRSRTRA